MSLKLDNVKTAFNKYRNNKANRLMILGYLEACLISFNVVPSNCTDLADFQLTKKNKFWFDTKENREEIILRLTFNLLKDNNLITENTLTEYLNNKEDKGPKFIFN